MKTNDAVKKAAATVGGVTKLAAALSVQPPTVSQWITGTRGVPPRQCYAIEKASSGAVTRRDLRPSDWWLIWPELVTADHPAPTSEAA
jgi:DNA-binding transcriptional regulator YdaS (Cro superfamily)